MSKIKMLYEINKYDNSPSFRSVRFPKLQIFVEIFCPVWSRHVGVTPRDTNMAARKQCTETSGTYFGYLGP